MSTTPTYTLDALDDRIKALPFPIASALDVYLSEPDPRDQIDGLRHAFEAIAQTVATAVLSGFLADDELLAASHRAIAGQYPGVAKALRRSSLGTWVVLSRALAREVGIHASTASLPRLTSAFGIASADRLLHAADGHFLECLDRATGMRNRVHGHDPRLTPGDIDNAVSEWREVLVGTLPYLEEIFRDWHLVSVGRSESKGGLLTYEARLLQGAPRRFRPTSVVSSTILESGALYLHDSISGGTVRLAPFIRIVSDRLRDAEGCYFFDRIESGEMRWKLFHSGAESEVAMAAPEVEETLRRLALDETPKEVPGPRVVPAIATSHTTDLENVAAAASPTAVTPEHSIQVDRPKPLVGRRLAEAAYGNRASIDPERKGRSVDEWLVGLRATGVVVPGKDPTQKIRSALNISQDRFERVGRGIWTWRLAEASLSRDAVDAEALRRVAYDVAQELDPQQVGLHYEEVKAALLLRGVIVPGPSQGRSTWAALGAKAARSMFEPIGQGRFVWRDQHKASNAEIVVVKAVNREALAIPSGHSPWRDTLERLDALMLSVAPDIGRESGDNEIVYLAGAEPIAYVTAESRLRIVVDLPVDRCPHLPGVIVHNLAPPGLDDELGEIGVDLDSNRAEAAGAILVATRRALASGLKFPSPELDAIVRQARDRFGLAGPPGWGAGDRPSAPLKGDRAQRFWSGLIDSHPWLRDSLRAKAPVGPRLGNDGRAGIYSTIRFDRYGTVVTSWVSGGATNVSSRQIIHAHERLQELLGGRGVVVDYQTAVFVAFRASTRRIDDEAAWPMIWDASANAMRRLLDAIEETGRRR